LRNAERENFLKNIWPGVVAQMQLAGIHPEELLELA
jgi:hypothetical protein